MRVSWLWFSAAAIWLVIFVAGVLLCQHHRGGRGRQQVR